MFMMYIFSWIFKKRKLSENINYTARKYLHSQYSHCDFPHRLRLFYTLCPSLGIQDDRIYIVNNYGQSEGGRL